MCKGSQKIRNCHIAVGSWYYVVLRIENISDVSKSTVQASPHHEHISMMDLFMFMIDMIKIMKYSSTFDVCVFFLSCLASLAIILYLQSESNQ